MRGYHRFLSQAALYTVTVGHRGLIVGRDNYFDKQRHDSKKQAEVRVFSSTPFGSLEPGLRLITPPMLLSIKISVCHWGKLESN